MKPPFNRTKIVATLGPASRNEKSIRQLIQAGVDVFRLNFAHADHREHADNIRLIRKVEKESRMPIGILQDLPGPKLRVGKIPGDGIELKRDDSVDLVPEGSSHHPRTIPILYQRLKQELKKGDVVFIADGLIRLVVETMTAAGARSRVQNGGTVRAGNGVNMPDSNLSLKAFTAEDRRHLAFGLDHGVDFIGVSFVGQKEDLRRIRAFCQWRGVEPFLISKIERQQALRNLNEIVEESDGIMVARGDLGVEVPFAEIPGLQQKIVDLSHRRGRPVIVATQVLESMIQNPRPTRAEATDVSVVVSEGADAVMLSGETAVGQYPVVAVQALSEILSAAESNDASGAARLSSHESVSCIIAEEACRIAERIRASVIAVPAGSVQQAAQVSRFRPRLPIVAFTGNKILSRKFSLYWGIAVLPGSQRTSPVVDRKIKKQLLQSGLVRPGQLILAVDEPTRDPRQIAGRIEIIRI